MPIKEMKLQPIFQIIWFTYSKHSQGMANAFCFHAVFHRLSIAADPGPHLFTGRIASLVRGDQHARADLTRAVLQRSVARVAQRVLAGRLALSPGQAPDLHRHIQAVAQVDHVLGVVGAVGSGAVVDVGDDCDVAEIFSPRCGGHKERTLSS